ncbi:UNVERIFIED_CONTAM: hypothetical protein Slati_0910500 [Sesamum latifolium]|uniref:Uncharacterized protein n=1 Tax=Sesamum latifolium TaxID=2727402 RepID=A0AAW2XNJ8_9LAMI
MAALHDFKERWLAKFGDLSVTTELRPVSSRVLTPFRLLHAPIRYARRFPQLPTLE